ncbi:GAF domain-containing protein [Metaclostridioides mangenotii]|uniref:Transcriptional regulator with PAS, ATPase and Fis domain n=1 Tax=Metaclostridioides mangenotii TaxID=1540 RepID=A0ABS4E8T5_9FIRM|nr:helix-turn-helix domain-containing protein [Clostridioides mangenotii]MBP1854351.1 transcriptional regulator with PAS, ATPase and Fis domain [Clostridioides mangenotii]
MNLNNITNYIQSICENISNVLDVDVTLVTNDLTRIAGTGIFKDKIGETITEKSAYSMVLQTGESYVIVKELDEKCNNCSNRESCKELADICTPVKLEDQILGILGVAAFSEEQKHNILSKDKYLTEFIMSMSDLISFKLDEMYDQEIKTMSDVEKEVIEKAIKKYGSNTEAMKQIADVLNIGIATLYRKVKKYNLNN